jgi:hypothetical protein
MEMLLQSIETKSSILLSTSKIPLRLVGDFAVRKIGSKISGAVGWTIPESDCRSTRNRSVHP